MVRANKRNEALRIESALLNKIAMLGTEKTAEVASILTNKKRPAATERSEQIQMEF